MKIILLIAVSALLSAAASAESTWIIGDEGESCNSVCRKNLKICNRDEQSRINSEEDFRDVLSKAGYPTAKDTCSKRVVFRRFSGSPCLAEGGKTCVLLPPGANSGCDTPKHDSHRPLCSCLARHERGCNPNFVDSSGDSCDTYSSNGWCTPDGNDFERGIYGEHWDWDWGTFDDYSNNGETAVVCPQCGCKATCEDGVQNQDEEETDCGGPCPACQRGYEVKRGHGCDGGYVDMYEYLHSAISSCNQDSGCQCIEWQHAYGKYFTHRSTITRPDDTGDVDAWVKKRAASIK